MMIKGMCLIILGLVLAVGCTGSDSTITSPNISEIAYIDNFEFIREMYRDINFLRDFEEGCISARESAIRNFYDLLVGNKNIYIPYDFFGFYDVLGYVKIDDLIFDFDRDLATYYLLDFTGNGTWDLGILSNRHKYIITYLEDMDTFKLWYLIFPGWDTFLGTATISTGGGVVPLRHSFVQLDEYGQEALSISIAINHYYPKALILHLKEKFGKISL